MKSLLRALWFGNRAVSATEFALLAPVLLMGIVGTGQLGVLFFANAGMRSAVGEGARYATIFPRPTDDQIRVRVSSKLYGVKAQGLSATTITPGKTDGSDYIDIALTYNVPLNFIFFSAPAVQLVETRRVFVQPVS